MELKREEKNPLAEEHFGEKKLICSWVLTQL